MDRKEFLHSSCAGGVCSAALIARSLGIAPAQAQTAQSEDIETIKAEKEFVEHWTADLLDSMADVLDRDTQVKIVEGCGRACFNRFQFKQGIAAAGKGDVDKLIEAYNQYYDARREGNVVHLQYRGSENGCKCPAAKNRPSQPDDIHCECTRATQQAIFETALGRPIKVEIVESRRRGGNVCRMLVHLT